MGRITLFSNEDILSEKLKLLFNAAGLPFTVISLAAYPPKQIDMHSLSSRVSVPQVFFNTRYVGGYEASVKEIQRWVKRSKDKNDLMERYKAEILDIPLDGHRFKLPKDVDPIPRLEFPKNQKVPLAFELPDGTATTIIDITERLRNTLPAGTIHHQNVIYLRAFTGAAACTKLQHSLAVTEAQSISFAQALLDAELMYEIESSSSASSMRKALFDNSPSTLYRLQCDRSPDILNSYCLWKSKGSNQFSNPEEAHDVVRQLNGLLKTIELACLNSDGMVDHQMARTSENYAIFEVAVCELQVIDMESIFGVRSNSSKNSAAAELLAFGLNVNNLMMRYALLKMGVPTNEDSRLKLLSNVKFDMGGNVYSFQDWIDGVLSGNKGGRFCKKKVFSMMDPRRKTIVSTPTSSIHYALSNDPFLGSSHSLPFSQFTADQLDKQLDMCTSTFCDDDSKFALQHRVCRFYVCKSFMWYRSDLGKKDVNILSRLGENLLGTKRHGFDKAMRAIKTGSSREKIAKISFSDDDYTRNIQNFKTFDAGVLNGKITGIKALFQRFHPARRPSNEFERLSTLHSLNILDTLDESRFDRLTKMAQVEFDVPLVFVSLVDDDRQWFKSKQWSCPLPVVGETPREISFCAHAILTETDEILVIPDATKDDRFAENPVVTGDLHVRFYAGCPLAVPSEFDETVTVNIGTLCVLDQKPREFSKEEESKLRLLAGKIRQEILRRGVPDNKSQKTPRLDSSIVTVVA